jgi:hypothetical protein
VKGITGAALLLYFADLFEPFSFHSGKNRHNPSYPRTSGELFSSLFEARPLLGNERIKEVGTDEVEEETSNCIPNTHPFKALIS